MMIRGRELSQAGSGVSGVRSGDPWQRDQDSVPKKTQVIRRLAAQGPCVIVGRGADDLLSDYPQILKIRLYASFEDKLRRCLEEYHMTREAALKAMELFDRRRAEHYAHYTGRDINDPHNYQLTLNVGALGLEECAVLIETS